MTRVRGLTFIGMVSGMLAAGLSSVASAQTPPAQPQAAQTASAQAPTQGPTAGTLPPVLVPTTPTTTKYDPNRGFPDHNGALSAMLIVIPAAELKEFDRPAGEGRHLDRVSRAEPGAQLALKLVFIGPKADWNANANVTYDLQVLAPDGKIYGASNYHGMVALQGKITTDAAGLYDNRPKVVIMQFERKDAPGVYKVKAMLHDNVAGLDVPLEAAVELLPKQAVVTLQASPPAATVAPAPDGTVTVAAATTATADADDDDQSTTTKKHHRRRRRHHR